MGKTDILQLVLYGDKFQKTECFRTFGNFETKIRSNI